MEMGIGDLSVLQRYVGIPYRIGGRGFDGIDCWGLVCAMYLELLNIELPDWHVDAHIDFELSLEDSNFIEISEPLDFCLVRVKREGYMPDHWGMYAGKGIVTAQSPKSAYIPFKVFEQNNPSMSFLAISLPDEVVN